MNILLIGNGFDLEHKLPTSYRDFLIFCLTAKEIFNPKYTSRKFQASQLDGWKIDDCVKQALLDAFDSRYTDSTLVADYDAGIRTSSKELNELYSYIKSNTWLEYFSKNLFSVFSKKFGQNWIDFETEISKVIQALDTLKVNRTYFNGMCEMEADQREVVTAIAEASKRSLMDILYDDSSITEFGIFLNSELEKMIRSLEIYLAGFVSKIAVNSKSPDIENLKPDCVLSFNYTDTYERVYGLSLLNNGQTTDAKKTVYDYIHGKALLSSSVSSCNLVLGIDEYLGNESKDVELDFLSFKKYYQRIFKSTGNRYLDWVDEIKDGYEKYLKSDHCTNACPNHTLYIFGHSLNVTDKDVLKLLICNDNVHTKIFYHRKTADDKKSLGKLIKNLVLIMGQDELIRRTGGAHKTIEFVPQTLHEDFESSVK